MSYSRRGSLLSLETGLAANKQDKIRLWQYGLPSAVVAASVLPEDARPLYAHDASTPQASPSYLKPSFLHQQQQQSTLQNYQQPHILPHSVHAHSHSPSAPTSGPLSQSLINDPSSSSSASSAYPLEELNSEMWGQYIQENWHERRTVPPDISKFRSPSNIRGAPFEHETTAPASSPAKFMAPRAAGNANATGTVDDWTVHSRMTTVDSVATSTYWSPSHPAAYAFVDPLRSENDCSMSLPISHLHISSGGTGTSPPAGIIQFVQGIEPWQTRHDLSAPSQTNIVPSSATFFGAYNTPDDTHNRKAEPSVPFDYLSTNLQSSLFPPSASSAVPISDGDSRRASTVTTRSSEPLHSPPDLYTSQYPLAASPALFSGNETLLSDSPHAGGVLRTGSNRSSLHLDYFSADHSKTTPKPHFQLAPVPISTPTRPVQPPSTVPRLVVDAQIGDIAVTRHGFHKRVPQSQPPAKRQRTSSSSVAPSGTKLTRGRTRSVLERATLPYLQASATPTTSVATASSSLSSKLSVGLGKSIGYRRLSSPIASVRPSESDSGTIEDEEDDDDSDQDDVDEVLNYPCPVDTAGALGLNGYSFLPHVKNECTSPGRPSTALPSAHGGEPLPPPLSTTQPSHGSYGQSWSTEDHDSEDETVPRKQKLRFPNDTYTPLWVKGSATQKEGLCDMCPAPGRWLQLKNSAFWYHKQFTHGISSVSGAPFAMPIETRKASESSATEGLCHQCNGWIVFTTKRQDANEQNPIPTLWFKHAHKCHTYTTKGKGTATKAKGLSKKRTNEDMD